MDTRTGQLKDEANAEDIIEMLRQGSENYVPVNRALRTKELADGNISMYAPCGCGSGKKFRFCCYRTKTGNKPDNHQE